MTSDEINAHIEVMEKNGGTIHPRSSYEANIMRATLEVALQLAILNEQDLFTRIARRGDALCVSVEPNNML